MKKMNAGKDGMKVLWLTNILFPEPCRMLGLPEPVLGGWMYAGAQELMKAVPDLKLAAAMFYPGNGLRRLDGESMTGNQIVGHGPVSYTHLTLPTICSV